MYHQNEWEVGGGRQGLEKGRGVSLTGTDSQLGTMEEVTGMGGGGSHTAVCVSGALSWTLTPAETAGSVL